tara:strand:- start:99098 stop:100024 length:927 start_codon:yes stop_codon:yes gene_type:complete
MILSSTSIYAEERVLALPGTIVYDEPEGLKVPRNFRLMSSPYKSLNEATPTRSGLDKLKLSASAQFSEETLKAVLPKMQGEVWVLDLRRESHGFEDGLPISWYAIQNQSNKDLTTEEILKKELILLKNFKQEKNPTVHRVTKKIEGAIVHSDPISVKTQRVESEQQLSVRLNLNYKRLPVADHHRPTDEQVDEFMHFYQSLPENAWIHMHCRGGKGRTTTFLMLVDMMNNAKTVSLEEIAARHILLGGSDLLNLSDEPEKQWKHDSARLRKSFVELFNHYAKSDDFPKLSWTEWLKQQTKIIDFDAPQ